MRILGSFRAFIAAAVFGACALAASAQEITLYSFAGPYVGDGSYPLCNPVFDAAGNIYGTTFRGGAYDSPLDTNGTVFELSPAAGGTWTEKLLYSFGTNGGASDGSNPAAGLVFDSSGNLYGATSAGGNYGNGTVYELSPAAGGTWTEKILYNFGATANDGATPARSLIFDSKGNLYGTTYTGGPNSVTNGAGTQNAGTAFELLPGPNGTWTEKILYNFGATADDAANSNSTLTFDSKGNLYGTSEYGGINNVGTVFELSPQSDGTWQENVIHSFALNGVDGAQPLDGLTWDTQGNLYGTTNGGGVNGDAEYGEAGVGAVYELSPAAGGTWTEQVIYSFSVAIDSGAFPYGTVTFDAAGNLYLTALLGPEKAPGEVLELSPGASGWTGNALYIFGQAPDGFYPQGGVIFDSQGNLYGTDSQGGAEYAGDGLGGTVWELPSVVTANPAFSIAGGTYASTQMVKLSDTTPNSIIHYSINGGAYSVYSSAIPVSESETIRAYATTTSVPQSQVSVASYQIGISQAPAALTAPTASILPGTSATFTWSAESEAAGYWLFIGTTGFGSKDLYDSGETTATSITYSALPLTGATIYVRLYTSFGGTLVHNDYTYTAAKQAILTAPAPGTLPGPSATFTWSAATGSGVDGYWLFLGTTGVGSKNLYDSGETTATSETVSNLPLTGATIYARVYTSYNGTLKYLDSTYTAAKQAVLTMPAPTTTLPGPSTTFTWSAATGANIQGYWLFLGTTGAGSKNLYDSGEVTATSATVNNLPITGATIYARVYTSYNGTLVYSDYTYTAAKGAVLTTPAPGSTLGGSTIAFDWSPATGSNVQGYWLFLGTSGAGSKNFYDSGETSALTETVSNLPTTGGTIYARVYTSYNGTLTYNDYTYTAK